MLHWRDFSQASPTFLINEVVARELKILERKESGEGTGNSEDCSPNPPWWVKESSECWVGPSKAHGKGLLESHRACVTRPAFLTVSCAVAAMGTQAVDAACFPWLPKPALGGHLCWGNIPNQTGICVHSREKNPFSPPPTRLPKWFGQSEFERRHRERWSSVFSPQRTG